MKFKDVFDIDELFHPKLFYQGEWLLGGRFFINMPQVEYLTVNAKKHGKTNLYEEFLNKYYYEPLAKILNSENIARKMPPRLTVTVDDTSGKKIVAFSLVPYIYYQIISLGLISSKLKAEFWENISSNRAECLNALSKLLEKEKDCYDDVLENGIKSQYYSNAFLLYQNTPDAKNMSFNNFLLHSVNSLLKLIEGNKNCLFLFNQEINQEDLLKCFDYDTFCLIAAKSALDICSETDEACGKLNNSIHFVRKYLDAVAKLENGNRKFNCQIVVPNMNPSKKGKYTIITSQDIIKEFENTVAKHPEYVVVSRSMDEVHDMLRLNGYTDEQIEAMDLSSREGGMALTSSFEKFVNDKKLATQWRIIPKGKGNPNSQSSSIDSNESIENIESLEEIVQSSTKKDVKPDDSQERMLKGKQYLDNSPYIYQLFGIDNFAGYIGYIYPNGTVIFEKFYENEKTKRIARERATYKMHITNFLQLSKKSKTEIIKDLTSGTLIGVKRIFHDAKMIRWKQEVEQAITGADYTDEIINYIDYLLDVGKLDKKELK